MLQPHHDPVYAALAARWSRPGPAERDLIDATREAFSGARPDLLEELRPLVELLLARAEEPDARGGARQALFALLDTVRRRLFTEALPPDRVEPWLALLLPIVDRADYTVGELLRSRAETDPRTVALRVLGPDGGDVSVAELGRRTRTIARGLLAVLRDDPGARVAILSENSLEAALCDLACLSNGIVDFPLPANAVAEQVVYMLRHSRAQVLLCSDDEQVSKVLPALGSLPDLRDIVVFSRACAERHGLLSLEQMVGQGGAFDDEARAARAARVRSRDLATVMYTSGTTGRPKGIQFTHQNLVTKRLCRGFALPSVGQGDVFLCYLPLYHTFGRWLELMGSIWWGATYVFARSPQQASLLEDFRSQRPTVFISVPKKWMEVHEAAVRTAASDDPDEVTPHLRAIAGGRLRFGLSAAGYLDPALFRAFQRAGIELCSGYGMTEATGGITMTAPGQYVDGSIGKPLPGIEAVRAPDGELLIRGPYVSPGYFEPEEDDRSWNAEGFFGTGDLVALDPEGHFRITGRKKEIYKNRSGQTIAPQRVENLFRDFDAVAQAFLVGDHREYNTLLIWPNYEGQPALREKTPEELRELISSLVASANRFLAPFERVVSFRVLPRALDEDHGELTKKGSFKREQVEEGWKALVETMYEQRYLSLGVDGMELRLPNWLLREMGVLQQEVVLREGRVRAGGRSLEVGSFESAPGSMRVGDLAYDAGGRPLDLGSLLARPALWLGNEGLRAFLGEEAFVSLVARRRKAGAEIRLDPRAWIPPSPGREQELLALVEKSPVSFHTIHAAGELLRAERPEASRAIAHLHDGLKDGTRDHGTLCRALLRRAADAPDEAVRRRAFRVLVPHEEPERTIETLRVFLDRMAPVASRDEDLVSMGEKGLSEPQVEVLLDFLASERARLPDPAASDRRLLVATMRLLTACTITHPAWYQRLRVPLARLSYHLVEEVAARASEEHDRLRRGFSNWVGPNLRRALDPDSGEEYGWKEVVVFGPGIGFTARDLLLRALTDTTLMRASVFLFGKGALISLADVPPGGAVITFLGAQHGKSVYRLSLATRARETFDIAINVAEAMPASELREEVSWLLAAGAPPPLVEAFGGYYPEYGIFTEEFIPGEDVGRAVTRLERQGELRRLESLWPFLAWTALSAHVDFWDRTGRTLALRVPSPAAFIIPSHDYQMGARLVSISDRSSCESFDELLERFSQHFVEWVEAAHAPLRGMVEDQLLFSAVVEALGLARAKPLVEQARSGRRGEGAARFLAVVEERGYTPKRVHFAARRYERWIAVNPSATLEAQSAMLGELWQTYRLPELEETWPDTRVRFFRQTIFAHARPELGEALDRLMARARQLPPGGLDLEEQVASIRGTVQSTAEEDYFLARMTYRYLKPTDDAALILLPSGGGYVTEVVVGLTNAEGRRFSVRAPATPREVAKLIHLFDEANLAVTFSAEHEFLLALDAKETVIGGLFYRAASADRVHMEKLVVSRKQRGKGVSDGLMREFMRRLKGRGVRALETGFFQPKYFRRYGFRTNPGSGGLVADLDAEATFQW
ncbi:MAG TPA: GNAT family N-acetyltransferase [Anaeromyxobacteraceae bacterium]|jgi:long-subunit acyl-CoA synthetase (AMP-forming)/GNAT superfamily N-acetyltransferase|nr:GNAT family N-acetyltransferase [Anaeromyxobacteraceae bacterium]